MEDVIVTAGAEAFGVDVNFSFASFACCDFWLPFQFFVALVAEAFGVMLFFLIAVDTGFYRHFAKETRSYIKNFVQTDYFRSFYYGRTTYNVYYTNYG